MNSSTDRREERRHDIKPPSKPRTEYQRDRDRVLYSPYFRRLANVTQVVSAHEGYVFHNRLTHSLEVAQIGRRLAERIKYNHENCDLNVDVVETACLAHDLGHPPFGHAGESALRKWATQNIGNSPAKCEDGFEGNAQTLRILTRLGTHQHDEHGLNLTRRSLQAILKYPWGYDDDRANQGKFCFYKGDEDLRQWIGGEQGIQGKTLECQVMDIADELTYSLHDFIDLTLADLIPTNLLSKSDVELDSLMGYWEEKAKKANDQKALKRIEYLNQQCGKEALKRSLGEASGSSSYAEMGNSAHRTAITFWQSELLTQYFDGCSLKADTIDTSGVSQEVQSLLALFQQAVWFYVIEGNALASQQFGQKKVIFNVLDSLFVKESSGEDGGDRFRVRREVVPVHLKHLVPTESDSHFVGRACVDVVASLSELELVSLHKRLTGYNSGSVRSWQI